MKFREGALSTVHKNQHFLDLVDYAQTDFGRCKILLFSTIIQRNCEIKMTEKYLIYMWRFQVAIF